MTGATSAEMTDSGDSKSSTLLTLTRVAHERYARHPAVTDGQQSLTFAELGRAARGLAASLSAYGLQAGDRVVWALHNRPDVLVIEHALFGSGLVRVALSARLHPREIASIAHDAGAAAIFCEPAAKDELTALFDDVDAAPLVATVGPELAALSAGPSPARSSTGPGVDSWPSWPAPDPDDIAALMYTSGTTGEPKGAIVTHRAWLAMTRGFWSALPPVGPGDVVLHCAPMSHFGGSVGSAVTLRGGAAVTLARFAADTTLDLVAHHRATVLPCVPTILTKISAAAGDRSDLTSLRAVVYGGSGIARQDAGKAAEVFPGRLYQCYGLAEALAPLTVLDARDHEGPALETAGRPLPEVELMIKTDSRDADDDCGEICVRGAPVTIGYWGRPDATVAAIDPAGWFNTGDVGYLDDNGMLRLVDRARDVIISGGFTVYPSEVERALREAPEVADAVVFGLPDQRWGETVTAVVVPADRDHPPSADDIIAFCRSRLASYKKPTRVRFADQLPIASTGKVDRRSLQDSTRAQLGI